MFTQVVPRPSTRRVVQAFVKHMRVVLPVLTCAVALSAWGATDNNRSPADIPSPSSASFGSSTDLPHAVQTLLDNFSQVSGHDAPNATVNMSDLRRAAISHDPQMTKSLHDAVIFLIASPVDRNFLSVAAGTGKRSVDDFITKQDLRGALATITGGNYETILLDTAAGNAGRDGIIGNVDYAAALRDPGVPVDLRNNIIHRLSNVQLLQIVGRPNAQGDGRDVADEINSFLGLARLSWLGAAEAEALAYYKVPFRMDRGAQNDKGFSFWDSQSMHISEKMSKVGAQGYMSEVLAHEGGHAIFQMSGLKDKVFKDVDNAHLTPHIGDIINEAFAGAFGNRAHIALFGHNDKNIDRHLALINDVGDSITSNSTYYANRYHVDTAAARSQIAGIKQVMDRDLVPYLQINFHLLGDSQLTLGLESAAR
jgi:hypothetical protein